MAGKMFAFVALAAMLAMAQAGGRHYKPVQTPSPACESPVPVAVSSPPPCSPPPVTCSPPPVHCPPPPTCDPSPPPPKAALPSPSPSPPPPSPSPPPPSPSPSPSPPPPKASLPDGFPWCKCNTNSTGLYTLTPTTSTPQANGFTRYCFALTARVPPASATGSCARFDLRKIEFNINRACQFVNGLTFGNGSLASSFSRGPNNLAAFKIGRPLAAPLGTLTDLAATSTPVCFNLPATCPLPVFCRGPVCTVAFFNPASTCCPLVNIAAA